MTLTDAAPAAAGPGEVPTTAEVVARARALAATLVDRQAETERRTFYAEDTHEEFRRAGLHRLLVPRRYGGHELGAETFLQVATALARGCPSTAWMYCFGASHALVAATVFDEPAQAELFADGDFVCPAVVGPSGTAERVDGGWVIDGTWGYCSGVPYATHFIGHTLVPGPDGRPVPMMFVVPRGSWRRHDDWGGQLGLRGSGSHSITIERVLVPDRFTRPTHMSQYAAGQGTPGAALHGPEYGAGPLGFMFLHLAALAVGMAQGALDAYAEQLAVRTTLFPPIVSRLADPDYQDWYGEAAGLITTADAAVRSAAGQWRAACELGAGFGRDEDLRIAGICREAIRMSWRAVEGYLFPTAGSSSLRSGERMERVWRDMSMMHGHAGVAVFLSRLANRAMTQARFADEVAFGSF